MDLMHALKDASELAVGAEDHFASSWDDGCNCVVEDSIV